jgi:carbonic anhydrase
VASILPLVVLGHEGCGPVQAALAVKLHGARERARIALLLESILPGLQDIGTELTPQDRLKAAVEANVRCSMHAQRPRTPAASRRFTLSVLPIKVRSRLPQYSYRASGIAPML